ncbi:hypothetical protein D3C81_1762290 [compost metagenome]
MRHRRRISQTGALDHQAVEGDFAGVQTFQQQEQGFGQVGVDAAANAAVGQGHDLHRFIAKQLGIDAGVTEFVFDHSDLQAMFGLEQMAQQGGLAGPQKTAEYCYRNGRVQTENLLN